MASDCKASNVETAVAKVFSIQVKPLKKLTSVCLCGSLGGCVCVAWD